MYLEVVFYRTDSGAEPVRDWQRYQNGSVRMAAGDAGCQAAQGEAGELI